MDQWEKYADLYDTHVGEIGDDVHRLFIYPRLEKLIGPLKNKDIVDLGCGNGHYVRLLAQRARSVVGVEKSRRLLQLARKRQNPRNIKFIWGDLEKILPLSAKFDVCTCTMVLHYVKNLEQAIRSIARLTKQEGRAIITVPHPGFDDPTLQGEEMRQALAFDNKFEVTYWARPLKIYEEGFRRAGFKTSKVEELVISDEIARSIPRWKAFVQRPRFAIMAFKKIK